MATDQPVREQTVFNKTTTPVTVTMIAGRLHRWTFTPWPGSWQPYEPNPGDLLRVFGELPDKAAD